MMWALFGPQTILAVLVGVLGYVYLVVQQNTARDDFTPLELHGPVLHGAVDGVKLDGLTLMRTVHMPAIIVKLPGIGVLTLKNHSSELVFDTLRVTDIRVRASDAARGVIDTTTKADVKMAGTCLARVELQMSPTWPWIGGRLYRLQQSGRLSLSLRNLHVQLPFFVGKSSNGEPRLRHKPMVILGGEFEDLSFSASAHAHLATKLPLWLTLAPIANFLLRDALRSHELESMLPKVWSGIKPYLEVEAWQSLGAERHLPPIKAASLSGRLEAMFSILGQTNFTNIELPDHSPELYKEGSKRAYLQSWNMLTSGVKCDIHNNKILKLAWNHVGIEWKPDTAPNEAAQNEAAQNAAKDGEVGALDTQDHAEKHIMVCRIEGLLAEVSSNFSVYVDMGKALQFVTNKRQLGEKAQSRAQARAARLELVFQVSVDETGVSVKTLRIDDLDHIEVSITGLKGRANDLVNSALKIIKPQIATVAGMLLRGFLEEQVKQSTKAIETVEDALLLRGVEVPGLFRARKRDHLSKTALEIQETKPDTDTEDRAKDLSLT